MIVSLITREYFSGRLAITTDRLGGFRTGNGYTPKSFWENLIKWVGKKNDKGNVNVAIMKNVETFYENFISRIESLNYLELSESEILQNGINNFDVLYFIGLPQFSTSEILPEIIEEYVRNGGGVIIESPDIVGEIEIISLIDSVEVSSIKRPSYEKAFWTQAGTESPIYVKYSNFSSFMVEIKDSDFSNNWDILLSDTKTFALQTTSQELELQDNIDNQDYSFRSFQEFGVGFIVGIKDGTVYLEEGSETSSSSSSSSSSSTIEEENWSFCDNIIANWKLNENNSNSFIWDSSGDFFQIGELKSNGLNVNTEDSSIAGKINNSIYFSETNKNNIVVQPGTKLNFTDGIIDSEFSITTWVKTYDDVGTKYILSKDGVWELFLINNQINFKLIDGANSRSASSLLNIVKEQWSLVSIIYDGLNITIYLNNNNVTGPQIDLGYSTMLNSLSTFYIGSSSSSGWFNGELDNVLILNKQFNQVEIEAIWSAGNGTEDCEGTLTYTSSSSSSSSSSLSSSSSSSSSA
jgi:hypothetical protein